MRKIFADMDLQEEFMQKGFVKVPMLSDDEINYLMEELQKLRPDDNFEPSDEGEIATTLHFSFVDTNIEYKKKTLRLLEDVAMPHIKKVLNNYKYLYGHFAVKPKGQGYLHPHQNYQYIADQNDTTVAVFCPLIDTNEINGAFHLIEGSHKIFPHIYAPNTRPYGLNIFKDLESYSLPIYLKAGESLYFDDSLLHWSPENNSDKPRQAFVIQCIPDDCQGVIFYEDRDSPEKRFEIFEVNSDFFINHTPSDVIRRPSYLKPVGFAPNKNKVLTDSEFIELLKQGKETRTKIYYPESDRSLLKSIKNNNFFKKIFKGK